MTENITKEQVQEAAWLTMGLIAEAVDTATRSLVDDHMETMTALTLACADLCELRGGNAAPINVDIMYKLYIKKAKLVDTEDLKKQFWERAHKASRETMVRCVENIGEKRND